MSPPIRDGVGDSIGSIRLGDGTEISEVRTGAGDVLFSAILDSVVDNFEADDADPAGPYGSGETIADYYGGDTGSYQRQTATVYEGVHALEAASGGGGTVAISSTSGLPPETPYFEQGDTFQCRTRIASEGATWGLFFGTQSEVSASSISGYGLYLDESGNEFHSLRRYDNGSVTDLDQVGSTTDTNSDNEWHRIHVDWAGDGTITATYYDSSDTQIFQLSATDTNYTSGGVGFLHNGATGEEAYFDAVEFVQ